MVINNIERQEVILKELAKITKFSLISVEKII
jgi:hypothetical protein